MKSSSTVAALLALCVMVLTGCASPPPRFSNNPSINRHLEEGSRDYHAGRLREARNAFAAAAMQAQRVDDNAHLVDAWMAKGATEVLLEDTSGARRTYTQAFAEARSAHLPAKAWQAELALADLDRRAGVVATARIQFAWLGEQGSADHFAIAQELALCDIAQQQPQRALGHLQPWLAQMPSLPLELRATLLANLARVRLALGEDDAAQTLALDALALDKQAQHPPAIAADHLLLAQVMQQAGHPAQAQEHLAKAQRIRLLMGLPAAVDATADPAKAPASAGAIN